MDLFKTYFLDILEHHYVDFEGRARRSEYWYFILFQTLAVLTLYGISGIGFLMGSNIMGYMGFALVCLSSFALFLPNLSVTVRRLHDTGKSGWMLFLAFIPFIGSIILFVFLLTDSQPETNIYGPNPKEG